MIAAGSSRLSSSRFSVLFPAKGAQSRAGPQLPREHRQHRIVAQLVMID